MCHNSQAAISNPEPPFPSVMLLLFFMQLEFHLWNTHKYWSECSAAWQNTAPEPSERGASQAIRDHFSSGRSCGHYEDTPPPPTHSLLTQLTMAVSQEKAKPLGGEHRRGLQWGLRPGKQGQNVLLAYLQLSSHSFPCCFPKFPSTLAREAKVWWYVKYKIYTKGIK